MGSSSLTKDGTWGLLYWECGVLANEPPGKSQGSILNMSVFHTYVFFIKNLINMYKYILINERPRFLINLNIDSDILIWYHMKQRITKVNLPFIGYIYP